MRTISAIPGTASRFGRPGRHNLSFDAKAARGAARPYSSPGSSSPYSGRFLIPSRVRHFE